MWHRYWQSTAAYTIATDCAVGDTSWLPPADDAIYRFPADLYRPTLVLLLSVTEAERNRRVQSRKCQDGVEVTAEETAIAADKLFRQRYVRTAR